MRTVFRSLRVLRIYATFIYVCLYMFSKTNLGDFIFCLFFYYYSLQLKFYAVVLSSQQINTLKILINA